MSNWGVIEERDEGGKFIAYHVMPMIHVDDETIPSAAHYLSDACPCIPTLRHCGNLEAFVGETSEDGKLKRWIMWDHHDATHPGSREREAETKNPTQRVQ